MYASRDPSGEMATRPDQGAPGAIASVESIARVDRTTCFAGAGRIQPQIAPAEIRMASTITVLYAVIVLAILISAGAIWGWMRPAPAKQVVRSTLAMDSTEAMAPGAPWSGRVAISPDGSRLAYIGGPRSQLLIRARNQLHAIAVPGTEGASTPFFSPDGSKVGFLRDYIV